ncbi:patatin-like phospholipase family protein [Alicyclobacillus tolerans]|uniref:patatin-like phospholipase family protein n=1 Tax=Alicyclobacillus tolerans TaxID=90970 RepID=UPI001F157707|nr:patatin-like phospholipase family protein [Alicyclobacillus tolerans]MCF8564404.1 patatin-like phospholipase family protein [Alicyclobacillus tolerans]
MAKRTVGVALGSGGAKGFAHVGVLKALDEHHIPVDVVAGSSMGSLIGAFYSTGMRTNFMERLACSMKWRYWVDLTVPRVGLIQGEKIRQMVHMLTRGLNIEQADKPLAIVATELMSKSLVVFRTGLIADAVRASISIPGVFVPFVTPEGIFVDGGVLERVPVSAAKSLGADVVIGVDVGYPQRNSVPETMLDVVMQSIDIMQETVYTQRGGDDADVLLRPDLAQIGTSHFQKAAQAIALGYEAALAAMPEIQQKVQTSTDSDCTDPAHSELS